MAYWELYDKRVKFDELLGKTLTKIDGPERYSEEVKFYADDGSVYLQYHSQDCCESVQVEEVIGDINDLIGSPILRAEEVEECPESEDDWESSTWTFYKLATIKGEVVIRWLGTSNGYYSESVDFVRLKDATKDCTD